MASRGKSKKMLSLHQSSHKRENTKTRNYSVADDLNIVGQLFVLAEAESVFAAGWLRASSSPLCH
jgi:hypothetical protein